MPRVIVIGGGLAGLAATAALGGAGFRVDLFESRAFLGGRATSFAIDSEVIDNCQHVLLGCCHNLLDFYRRLHVGRDIRFYREFTFVEPGGRISVLKPGPLPAPLHFLGSFLRLKFLNAADKLSIARGLAALRREYPSRTDLDSITMLDWLREKKQTPQAIRRFWSPVLVSAINEEPARMAAMHGFQVFRLGFLAGPDACEMGVPAVPLGQLYSSEVWKDFGDVSLHLRAPVDRIRIDSGIAYGVEASGHVHTADYYVCCLPFERINQAAPGLALDLSGFEHSPITGIHLWFDRPVTDLPQIALLDRTIQWAFNKSEGRYLQLVVSASRTLVEMPRADIIALAVRELAEFLPAVRAATLVKAHVIKEVRATFSAKPGLEPLRPPSRTKVPNLFLAGDWTKSGWPATMEGSVRSGYLAAEAVCRAAGAPAKFLIPDALI